MIRDIVLHLLHQCSWIQYPYFYLWTSKNTGNCSEQISSMVQKHHSDKAQNKTIIDSSSYNVANLYVLYQQLIVCYAEVVMDSWSCGFRG